MTLRCIKLTFYLKYEIFCCILDRNKSKIFKILSKYLTERGAGDEAPYMLVETHYSK